MGKIVVITGAGAGVGRATAPEFARNGCDVALLSRDPDRLEQAATELRRYGVRALPIPTDVADYQAVEAAVEQVENELGPIDVWSTSRWQPSSCRSPADGGGGRSWHCGHLFGASAWHDVRLEVHASTQPRFHCAARTKHAGCDSVGAVRGMVCNLRDILEFGSWGFCMGYAPPMLLIAMDFLS